MKVGFEPTSSDYEPDKLPITLSHLLPLLSEKKDLNL